MSIKPPPEAARRDSPSIEQEELRGISRTVAEIHWLLLILVLLYLIFGVGDKLTEAAVISATFFYAALTFGVTVTTSLLGFWPIVATRVCSRRRGPARRTRRSRSSPNSSADRATSRRAQAGGRLTRTCIASRSSFARAASMPSRRARPTWKASSLR